MLIKRDPKLPPLLIKSIKKSDCMTSRKIEYMAVGNKEFVSKNL